MEIVPGHVVIVLGKHAECRMVIATGDARMDTGEQTVMNYVAARPSGYQSVIKYDVTARTVTDTLDVLFFVSI